MFFAIMAAVIGAMVIRSPKHSAHVWGVILLAGFTTGMATLMAAWAAFASRHRWIRLLLVLIAPPLLAVPLVRLDGFLIGFPELTFDRAMYVSSGFDAPYAENWIFIVLGIAVITALWLFSALGCGFVSPTRHDRPTLRRLAKFSICALTLTLILPCVITYARVVRRPSIPQPNVASPNGYDDIVAAGKLLVRSAVLEDTDSATADSLAREVARNENAFERLRTGLAKPCERHLDFESDSLPLREMNDFRDLARALRAEGRLAELEGRYDDAVRSYLDVVRMAHCIVRGGLIVDWLVGRAIEGIGIYGLVSIRTELTAEQSSALERQLRRFERRREPFEAAARRDLIWEEMVYGWRGRLDHYLQTIAYGDPNAGTSGSIATSESRRQAGLRLLILELAIRRYSRRHGVFPDTLEDVVAADDWVLRDPASINQGDNFIYRPQDPGFLLYSVGSDGDDDGGRTGDWFEEGDTTLASLYYDGTARDESGAEK